MLSEVYSSDLSGGSAVLFLFFSAGAEWRDHLRRFNTEA